MRNLYRHELKYMISEQERDLIIPRLVETASVDRHAKNGHYTVRSLYYDDLCDSCYETKQDGVAERKKYRIRIYDYSDSFISLECKKKRGSFIFKESCVITQSELTRILSGDTGFLKEKSDGAAREFYAAFMSDGIRPRVIVDYERIPFFYDAGTVRITFDEHVRAGFFFCDLFDRAIPVYDTLDPGKLIMEVKYTEFLPDIFRVLLSQGSGEYTASSKYVLCTDAMRKVRRLGVTS